jgi:hypothetical protein
MKSPVPLSRAALVGFALGAVSMVVVLCPPGRLPPRQALGACAALALAYLGPGLCLAQLGLAHTFSAWQRAMVGLVAGPLVALPVVYLAAFLGVDTERLPWVELVLALAGGWGWWRTLRSLSREPPRIGRAGALSLLVLWTGVVLAYVVPCVTDLVFEPDGRLRVRYLDSTWTWALVSLSRYEVPPPSPVFPTQPLSYHSFPALLAARLSVLSGLEGADALQCLVRPLLVTQSFLGVVLAGVVLGDIWPSLTTTVRVGKAGPPSTGTAASATRGAASA